MNFFDNIQDTFFLFLSVVAIISSLGVILLPNLVYAAFFIRSCCGLCPGSVSFIKC